MTSRILLFTVLATLLVYYSSAQRVTDITVSGHITGEKGLRLIRNSRSDSTFNNTFLNTGQNLYKARITIPAPELITLAADGFTKVLLLAPGFNLEISIHDSAGVNSIELSGAGAKLQKDYETFRDENMSSYDKTFRISTHTERTKLLSEKLALTDKIVTRQLKDYFCYRIIGLSIDLSADVFQLNENKLAWQPAFTSIAESYLKKHLDDRYNIKLDSFLTAMKCRPAPDFALYDTEGKKHNFSEMAGKVIYIDFWASWCAPCRVESGYLKTLKKAYGNQNNIVFVGIAIADINWKRAILEDKPDWLQLRDANGKVAAAYGVAGLPRYVLIGKDGKVADHNAPAPSKKEELTSKINKLLKQ
ncbi:MAG: TlpA disulfide reductase family protein [Flavitalea sp.]